MWKLCSRMFCLMRVLRFGVWILLLRILRLLKFMLFVRRSRMFKGCLVFCVGVYV